ncbi:hypothetical protein ACHAXR_008761 [Thalassiosira sp. AJA248-18]
MESVSQVLSSPSSTSQWTPPRLIPDAPFPSKLCEMLHFAEHEGLKSVVSWRSHGRAFKIHNKEKFMSHVAHRFFKATKLRSIHRQLNLWGFKRITSGEDRDAWFHEFFVRGQPGEMRKIIRTKIKGRTLLEAKRDLDVPNFYQMPTFNLQNSKTDRPYISDPDDEYENMVRSQETPPTMKPRRVSIAASPGVSIAASPELIKSSSRRALLPRRDRYRQGRGSNETAELPSEIMIEPLPFGRSDDTVPLNNDEFSLFIDRMITSV